MGATIWVVSRAREADGDDWDNTAVWDAIEKLDALCLRLGVAPLSAFLYDELGGDAAAEARWHPPDAALASLRALRDHLRAHASERAALYAADRRHFADYLPEELDHCIERLEAIRAAGDAFRLAVVG